MPLPRCFQELNCDQKSSFKEVKNQYYRLSKKYHPDVNKDPDALKRFQNINEAFQTIKKDFDNKKKEGETYTYYEEEYDNQQHDQNQTYNQQQQSNYRHFYERYTEQQRMQYEEFKQRYAKIDRTKYDQMTKQDIYKIIFGRTYEEDPMAMYRKENQFQRKCYEQEIKIWVQKNKNIWKHQDETAEQPDEDQVNYEKFYKPEPSKDIYSKYNKPIDTTPRQLSTVEAQLFMFIIVFIGIGVYFNITGKYHQKEKNSQKSMEHVDIEKMRKIYKEKQKPYTEQRLQKIEDNKLKKPPICYKGKEDQLRELKVSRKQDYTLPKEIQELIPVKGKGDYWWKCTHMHYKHWCVYAIVSYLNLHDIQEAPFIIRDKFEICPGVA